MSEQEIKKINEKIDTILKVLQDFGLNVIQSIGGVKHSVGILNEQIESLSNTMTYLKGIGVKLESVESRLAEFSTQQKYLESLIKTISIKSDASTISIGGNPTKSEGPEAFLIDFQNKLPSYVSIESLITDLEKMKENLFTVTGGHRVLFDINTELKNLKRETSINEPLLTQLSQKFQFWINKLKNG